MKSVKEFVRQYSLEDFNLIKFIEIKPSNSSNEIDQNAVFRDSVIEYIMDNRYEASNSLLMDLFQEESKCCEASFGVSRFYVGLASAILKTCGIKGILHFMSWKDISMDTSLSCEHLNLTKKEMENILSLIDVNIDKTEEGQQRLMTEAKEEFLEYIENEFFIQE